MVSLFFLRTHNVYKNRWKWCIFLMLFKNYTTIINHKIDIKLRSGSSFSKQWFVVKQKYYYCPIHLRNLSNRTPTYGKELTTFFLSTYQSDFWLQFFICFYLSINYNGEYILSKSSIQDLLWTIELVFFQLTLGIK